MRSAEDFNVGVILYAIPQCLIVISVRISFAIMYRRRISLFFGPIAFFLHVGSTHEFHAKPVSVLLGLLKGSFQKLQAVFSVQLYCVEDHGPFAIVCSHQLLGHFINRILKPCFLRINKNGHLILFTRFADETNPFHGKFPLKFFLLTERSFRIFLGQ